MRFYKYRNFLKDQSTITTVSATTNPDILATVALNSGGFPRERTAITILDNSKK